MNHKIEYFHKPIMIQLLIIFLEKKQRIIEFALFQTTVMIHTPKISHLYLKNQ